MEVTVKWIYGVWHLVMTDDRLCYLWVSTMFLENSSLSSSRSWMAPWASLVCLCRAALALVSSSAMTLKRQCCCRCLFDMITIIRSLKYRKQWDQLVGPWNQCPVTLSTSYLLAKNLLLQTSHWILIRSSCSVVCARLRPRASFSRISWFFSRAKRSKWYWRSSPTDATSSFFSSRFTWTENELKLTNSFLSDRHAWRQIIPPLKRHKEIWFKLW